MADSRFTTLEKAVRAAAERKVVNTIEAACAPLQALMDQMVQTKAIQLKSDVTRALDVIKAGLAEQLLPSVYEAEVQDLLSRKP